MRTPRCSASCSRSKPTSLSTTLRIVAASRASRWTDWTTLFDRPGMNVFGEVNVDTSRLAVDGVLSVQYQQRSSGTTPSPIRVADFRLG